MRTAIFDLDGTLADTSADLVTAANATLAEAGIAAALDKRRDRATAMQGGRAMLRLALGRLGRPDDALIDRLYPRLLAHYGDCLDAETRLFEGVEATLAALSGSDWRLGICTNKPQALAEALIASLGLAGTFHALIGADLLAVRKPDPFHLTETIRRAGGEPSRAVLVGDTITDLNAARAAGMPCILVRFEAETVAALAPDAFIAHYDELPALLEALVPAVPA
ncbi:phosphoglycolate phosphatase [soil metagenome]